MKDGGKHVSVMQHQQLHSRDQVLSPDAGRAHTTTEDTRAGDEDAPTRRSEYVGGTQRGGDNSDVPSSTKHTQADAESDTDGRPRIRARLGEELSDIEAVTLPCKVLDVVNVSPG